MNIQVTAKKFEAKLKNDKLKKDKLDIQKKKEEKKQETIINDLMNRIIKLELHYVF